MRVCFYSSLFWLAQLTTITLTNGADSEESYKPRRWSAAGAGDGPYRLVVSSEAETLRGEESVSLAIASEKKKKEKIGEEEISEKMTQRMVMKQRGRKRHGSETNRKRRRNPGVASTTGSPQTMPYSLYNHFRPLEQDLPGDSILPFLDFGRKLSTPSGANSIESSSTPRGEPPAPDPPEEDDLTEEMDVSVIPKAVERNTPPRVPLQLKHNIAAAFYKRNVTQLHPVPINRTIEANSTTYDNKTETKNVHFDLQSNESGINLHAVLSPNYGLKLNKSDEHSTENTILNQDSKVVAVENSTSTEKPLEPVENNPEEPKIIVGNSSPVEMANDTTAVVEADVPPPKPTARILSTAVVTSVSVKESSWQPRVKSNLTRPEIYQRLALKNSSSTDGNVTSLFPTEMKLRNDNLTLLMQANLRRKMFTTFKPKTTTYRPVTFRSVLRRNFTGLGPGVVHIYSTPPTYIEVPKILSYTPVRKLSNQEALLTAASTPESFKSSPNIYSARVPESVKSLRTEQDSTQGEVANYQISNFSTADLSPSTSLSPEGDVIPTVISDEPSASNPSSTHPTPTVSTTTNIPTTPSTTPTSTTSKPSSSTIYNPPSTRIFTRPSTTTTTQPSSTTTTQPTSTTTTQPTSTTTTQPPTPEVAEVFTTTTSRPLPTETVGRVETELPQQNDSGPSTTSRAPQENVSVQIEFKPLDVQPASSTTEKTYRNFTRRPGHLWVYNQRNHSVVRTQPVGVAYTESHIGLVTYVLAALALVPLILGLSVLARQILKKSKKKVLDESEYSSEYNRTPLPTKLPRVPAHINWEGDKPVAQVTPAIPATKWEFSRDKLRLQTVLGQGNFGQVWKAEADDLSGHEGSTRLVAVKTVKEGSTLKEKEDLLRELAIMQELGSHPNVVTLLGCCTEKEPYLLIMEYVMYGKLLAFLREHRTRAHYFNFSDLSSALTARDLTFFSYCVARGMEYLVTKGIIHRDLAARNILVDHTKLCKIADFGMSRNVRDTGEIYEQKPSRGALPIRWMAPESLHLSVFTHKSDVWSFGILLWEIVTLGSTPYNKMGAREVMRQVRDGYRLERPKHCRPEFYKVMRKCWASDPGNRPSFTELKQDLANLLNDEKTNGEYVDLDALTEEMCDQGS